MSGHLDTPYEVRFVADYMLAARFEDYPDLDHLDEVARTDEGNHGSECPCCRREEDG